MLSKTGTIKMNSELSNKREGRYDWNVLYLVCQYGSRKFVKKNVDIINKLFV